MGHIKNDPVVRGVDTYVFSYNNISFMLGLKYNFIGKNPDPGIDWIDMKQSTKADRDSCHGLCKPRQLKHNSEQQKQSPRHATVA